MTSDPGTPALEKLRFVSASLLAVPERDSVATSCVEHSGGQAQASTAVPVYTCWPGVAEEIAQASFKRDLQPFRRRPVRRRVQAAALIACPLTTTLVRAPHPGEVITIRVAFKPTSTIGQKQKTVRPLP